MNDKTFNNKILIIGTGPGALSCAYKLYENGYRPIIIESGQLPGGFMRNVCFENYKVDLGRKELYTRLKEVNSLWERILKEDYIEYDYRIGVLYDGKILEKNSSYLGFKRGMDNYLLIGKRNLQLYLLDFLRIFE